MSDRRFEIEQGAAAGGAPTVTGRWWHVPVAFAAAVWAGVFEAGAAVWWWWTQRRQK